MKIFGISQTSTFPEVAASWISEIIMGALLSLLPAITLIILGAALTLKIFLLILLSGGLTAALGVTVHEYGHAIMARIVGFTDITVQLGDGYMSYAELRTWEFSRRDIKEKLWRKHVAVLAAGPCAELVYAIPLVVTSVLGSGQLRYYAIAGTCAYLAFAIFDVTVNENETSDKAQAMAIIREIRALRQANNSTH